MLQAASSATIQAMATNVSMRVNPDEPLFVFVGGGSGGHIAPAIVTARMLQRAFPRSRHHFLCSTREIDRRMLQNAFGDDNTFRAEFPFDYTVRTGFFGGIRTSLQLLIDTVRSVRMLRALNPAVVISLGARPAIAPGLAARLLRIPLILLEFNAAPGTATRLLSRFADMALTGIPISTDSTGGLRCPQKSTGVPLLCNNHDLESPALPAAEYLQRRQLLILGGSQGASELNQLVPAAIRSARLLDSGWSVLHQHGEGKDAEARAAWGADVSRVTLASFLQNPSAELARSAFVICRSGAVTLAEISNAGIPALLLPLQNSSHSHQWRNAEWARDSGFAELLEFSADSSGQLRQSLQALCDDEQRRLQMCTAATAVARPSAARAVADAISSMLKCDLERAGESVPPLDSAVQIDDGNSSTRKL